MVINKLIIAQISKKITCLTPIFSDEIRIAEIELWGVHLNMVRYSVEQVVQYYKKWPQSTTWPHRDVELDKLKWPARSCGRPNSYDLGEILWPLSLLHNTWVNETNTVGNILALFNKLPRIRAYTVKRENAWLPKWNRRAVTRSKDSSDPSHSIFETLYVGSDSFRHWFQK